MIEMTMGGLVLVLLALVTAYLWQDWHTNTREFRELHRRLLQKQDERRGGEER